MLLSVIIVNYNVKYFLEHCLRSVINACREIDVEILVADNASSDDSKSYLAHRFPEVQFYWNTTNSGFAKANNEMLKNASGAYVLFLNPDTIVAEDCFTSCISFLKSKPDAGALGVHMIDGSGKFLPESKRGLPSVTGSFFKMSGIHRAFPRSKFFSQYYDGHIPEYKIAETAVLSGAFMMLTRKAVDATQGFDESFFMYGEDIDLSKRILDADLKNYYYPATTIIHFKGESTQRKSKDYFKHFYGAMKLYAVKHYGNKLELILLKAAVRLASAAAMIKNKFSVVQPGTAITGDMCIVAGSNSDAKKIEQQFFPGAAVEFMINADTLSAKSLATSAAKNIIFSNASRSAKTNIESLKNMSGKKDAMFFSEGAESIIGSNNKNGRGSVITMK